MRNKGRPRKAEAEKLRGYRYNLNLDRDLKSFLHEIVWRRRTSITQYINDLIRSDMNRNGYMIYAVCGCTRRNPERICSCCDYRDYAKHHSCMTEDVYFALEKGGEK